MVKNLLIVLLLCILTPFTAFGSAQESELPQRMIFSEKRGQAHQQETGSNSVDEIPKKSLWDLSSIFHLLDDPGWRLPVDIRASVRQGYDSNVLTSPSNKISSQTTSASGGVSYKFGGRRLRLETNLGLGATYYYNRPDRRYDYSGAFNLNFSYQLNRRMTFSFNNETRYVPDTDFGIVGGALTNNEEYIFQSTSIAFSLLLSPRWSTLTDYNFTAIYYTDSQVNEIQGRVSQSLGESIRLIIAPSTGLSLIYRVNPVTYVDSDYNSFGQFLLLGLDHVFSSRFSTNLQGGGEYRINRNPFIGETTYFGPFLEWNLRYSYGPASFIDANLRYGTETSDFRNVTQTTVLRFGLNAVYALTRRISLSMGVNFQNRYNDQPEPIDDYNERVISFSLGATFKVNRFFSVDAGYTYSRVSSPEFPQIDYDREIFFVGANIEI